MSTEPSSDLEGKIHPGHAEQLRNALSTIVGAELDDRDLDEDSEPDPVYVTLDELVRAVPFGREKVQALLDQNVSDVGSGIDRDGTDDRYEIDPWV